MTATRLHRSVDWAKATFIPIGLGRRVRSGIWAVVVAVAFVIALIPLGGIIWTVVSHGFTAIINPDWWSHSLKGVLPQQFAGGVYHAIYGTLVQAGIATIIAVPLGIMVAVYLVEYGRRSVFARVTTFMVDILSGVPSIVAALFVFALWVMTLGMEQSALAVSLALVMLMLPLVIRSTEEMLKLVPDDLREASLALGLSRRTTITRVVLPTAASGIVSGVLLAIARAMGETAPVLVLVGYSNAMNYDVLGGNMASLPLLIKTEFANPQPAGQLRAWGAALTLILIIAALNLAATLVAHWLSRKQRA